MKTANELESLVAVDLGAGGVPKRRLTLAKHDTVLWGIPADKRLPWTAVFSADHFQRKTKHQGTGPGYVLKLSRLAKTQKPLLTRNFCKERM